MKDSPLFRFERTVVMTATVLSFWYIDVSTWINGITEMGPAWWDFCGLALVFCGWCLYVERTLEKEKP
jgi:hypothetical protein